MLIDSAISTWWNLFRPLMLFQTSI
jgi:hypothetical protein